MEERILQFFSALRSSGVRISLAESADAMRAIETLGVKSRENFRIALKSTVIKQASDLPKFEELFAIFFLGEETPQFEDLTQNLFSDEMAMMKNALEKYTRERLKKLLDRLLYGRPLSEDELSLLAEQVGISSVQDLKFKDWMAQRMAKALGFDALRHVLTELRDLLESLGFSSERAQEILETLLENRDALWNQMQQYAGRSIAEKMSTKKTDLQPDGLLQKPFQYLSEREIEQLRKETTRLASALRTKIALRQKRAKSGELDSKTTIRKNLKNSGIPIIISYRNKSLKPKLVAICDLSTSMRSCSEFMLSLLYSLHSQIKKTNAFAFIDHLEDISPDFENQDAQFAVEQVLSRMPSGHYNTDLGNSLADFFNDFLGLLDHNTTLIIVGDGRNNFNNPRIDIFGSLKKRAEKIIWLNPEPQHLWKQGDSDMNQYAPLCDHVLQVGTMSELAVAIDQLLS